jgi:hypothetical protein
MVIVGCSQLTKGSRLHWQLPAHTREDTPLEISEKNKLSQPASTAAAGSKVSSPSSAWRRIFSFPVVLATSLAYLVFIFSRRDIGDPDLWWHLRNAQSLLASGHFSVVDSYSYTSAGAPALPFEWLAELAYYAAYKWAGLNGVFLLVFLLCAAIILGIFRLSYLASHDVKNSFVFAIGGAVLAAISIGARTLLFGWLYLIIMLLILEAARRGGWKWLWLLPPLFCLWANTHGSWPMGMVLFGIFIASGLVEGNWGHAYATRWSGPELRRLLIAAVASVFAVFINPFGARLVAVPFRTLFSSGIGNIQEFMSVDFHTPWGRVAMALILGVVLVAVFSRERWRLDEVGFTVAALYYGLTYSRFLFLAGILLPPIFARRVKLMTAYDRSDDGPVPNAVALAVLLCLFIVSVPRHSKFQDPVQYPEGAVAYIRAHEIRGRIFHPWVWGGYLIWHTPELKVFIDGRGDPYAANGVFNDYLAADAGENPRAVLDKYHVEYVLMPADSLLVQILKSDPAWAVRYSDKTSVLLQRSPAS